jgi:hypothetical protein
VYVLALQLSRDIAGSSKGWLWIIAVSRTMNMATFDRIVFNRGKMNGVEIAQACLPSLGPARFA